MCILKGKNGIILQGQHFVFAYFKSFEACLEDSRGKEETVG